MRELEGYWEFAMKSGKIEESIFNLVELHIRSGLNYKEYK